MLTVYQTIKLSYLDPIPRVPESSSGVPMWYLPPELLLCDSDYSFESDMWAVGCIFAEMAGNREHSPLFE
jgi:serine/threonine protein kinase